MSERPNVVLLVLDTLRAKNVSCYGYERETTPFIDSIAEEGTRFHNAYTVSPWTLPAHASLFTGRYPSEHGAGPARRLGEHPETLAEKLSEAGYSTTAVTNNIWVTPEHGFARGFDSFELMWQKFDTLDVAAPLASSEAGWKKMIAVLRRTLGGNVLKRFANLFHGYRYQKSRRRAEKTNQRALDNIGEEPFFLFVNYMEPHTPYRPPEEYAERFLPEGVRFEEADSLPQEPWEYVFGDREYREEDFEVLEALYDAAVNYLDDQVRALVDHIEEEMERETLFIITSDHGENIGEHGLMAHHYSLENTVMRVPLVLYGPGFKEGRVVEESVDLLDVQATLLDAGEAGEGAGHGESLMEMEKDRIPERFAQYDSPLPPVERLKERFGVDEEDLDGRNRMDAVFAGDIKMIRFANRSELRMNDYEEEEMDDDERRAELEEMLDSWESDLSEGETPEQMGVDSEVRKRLEELGYY